MKTLKFSIIIPFYKVEKYISACLDSVYLQDIPEEEYEVICVNDCSPDGSREIVLEYQKMHLNLILIEHEENKMLGAGRNTGLSVAQGEYIWFLDSDDYMKDNSLGLLYSIAQKEDLDILHFNSMRFNEKNEYSDFVNFPYTTPVITGLEFCKQYLLRYWNLCAWSLIYKRDFLVNNDLLYPEGVYFEDNLHTLKAYMYASRFLYIDKQLHFYRLNEQSITNSNDLWSGRKLADRVQYNVESIDFICQFLRGEDDFKLKLIECYIWALNKYRKVIINMTNKERNVFYLRISEFDFNQVEKYMNKVDFVIYARPIFVKSILGVISPAIRVMKNLKK